MSEPAVESSAEVDHLLTAEQLADRWQVKPTSIYEWARRGELPAVRLGRLYRFRIEAVIQFEKEGGMSRGHGTENAERNL